MATEPIALDRLLAHDERGRVIVAGTPFSLGDVVLAHLAWGWSAAEIHEQFERRLSMAQIHAALAYYFAHRDDLDAQIAADLARSDQRRQESVSPFADRMRAAGRLPR